MEEDRDLERRVERLEDQQSSWWQITTDQLTRESRRDRRLARMESDVGLLRTDVAELKTDMTEVKTDVRELKTDMTEVKADVAELKTDVRELKTDMTEVKADVRELKTDMTELHGQVNRGELASARRFDKIDAQLETIRGLIADREERGG
jgi:chromosome segregation ATPase